MDIKFKQGEEVENESLNETVERDGKLKETLVNYVGDKLGPDNDEVTVGMIVEVIADEFPEFVMALAEENFIRGYKQALVDIDIGEDMVHGLEDENSQNKELS